MVNRIIKCLLLFLAGNITVFIGMYYLTWGTMGFFEDGDIAGLTRTYGLMGGSLFAFLWGRK